MIALPSRIYRQNYYTRNLREKQEKSNNLHKFRFIGLLRGAIPSPGGKVAHLSTAKD